MNQNDIEFKVTPSENPDRISIFSKSPVWCMRTPVAVLSKYDDEWSFCQSTIFPGDIEQAIVINDCFNAAFKEVEKLTGQQAKASNNNQIEIKLTPSDNPQNIEVIKKVCSFKNGSVVIALSKEKGKWIVSETMSLPLSSMEDAKSISECFNAAFNELAKHI